MIESAVDYAAPLPAPPFFIVGNDRSGTTMLRVILDRGQEAAIPTESMLLGDFAPVRAGKLDLADHAAATRFARTVWEHPKVKLWNLEGDPPVPPVGLTHEQAYRFAVEAPYRAYAAQEGKQRWGDKTPYYLMWIEEVLAVWPDARIVVLVRDGRDVALSIRRLPFGANNTYAAACDWAEGIRLGLRAENEHPQNVVSVKYEDLVSVPDQSIRRICDFLELTYSPAMLQIEDTPKGKIVADQESWFTNLWAGINQKSVGKWRTKMSAREQQLFATVAGPELATFGYDLGEHARTPVVLGTKALYYRAHNLTLKMLHFVRLRVMQEHGREIRYVLRRKLRSL